MRPTRQQQGLPPLPFGAALHLGEILWGNIGAADRLDFTAIGPAVNLVSRLDGLCRPLQKTVLASGALAAEVETPLIALGTHTLRGIPRRARSLRCRKIEPAAFNEATISRAVMLNGRWM
jgi:adenylate cyclase